MSHGPPYGVLMRGANWWRGVLYRLLEWAEWRLGKDIDFTFRPLAPRLARWCKIHKENIEEDGHPFRLKPNGAWHYTFREWFTERPFRASKEYWRGTKKSNDDREARVARRQSTEKAS